MPIHCIRCFKEFPTKNDHRNHQLADDFCGVTRTKPTFVGFNEEQEEKLRSRKQKTKDVVERWKDVYRILFPDDDERSMPSPCKSFIYFNAVQFTDRKHPDHDTPNISIEQYNSLIQRRVHEELIGYDKHQRQILPVLIQSKLGNIGDNENSSSAILTSVIEECLSEALNDYHLSSIPDIPLDTSAGVFRDAGEPSTQDELAVHHSISGELIWGGTGVDEPQPDESSVQDGNYETVSFKEFQFDTGSSEHDSGFSDFISYEDEAYEASKPVLG
jgi:hypothetical protein